MIRLKRSAVAGGVLSLALLLGCRQAPQAASAVNGGTDPLADEAQNIGLVGHNDLQGRESWNGTSILDVNDPANPKLVWHIPNDNNAGSRSVSVVYDYTFDGSGRDYLIRNSEFGDFSPDALPRTYAFVVDEAGAPQDLAPCRGIRSKSYVLDITNEARPIPVSTWQVPADAYCNKGGRFGPHQQAETVNGRLNRFEDKLAWVAYFNAGVRLVDLSDP